MLPIIHLLILLLYIEQNFLSLALGALRSLEFLVQICPVYETFGGGKLLLRLEILDLDFISVQFIHLLLHYFSSIDLLKINNCLFLKINKMVEATNNNKNTATNPPEEQPAIDAAAHQEESKDNGA